MITGTSGTASAQTLPPLLLTISDPCKDPNFVTLGPAVMSDQQYALSEPSKSWTHDAFVVTTSPITHILCGDPTYSATFNGNAVDSTTTPLSYDVQLRQFTIQTGDANLVGDQQIVITAILPNTD